MKAAGGKKSRKVYVRESTGSRVLEQGRVRLLCIALFFFLCFSSIGIRLVEMMIAAPHPLPSFLTSAIDKEEEDPEDFEVHSTEARLKRGDITDRNGTVLATSLMTASAFANPREVSNQAEAAVKLERALGIPHDVLLKRLGSRKSFVWLKRHLTPTEQQAVNSLGIPGVYFLPEEQRVYPYGSAFAHVVGYVGVDNHGLAGIEKFFDKRLNDEQLSREPLALAVDMRVQHILRDEMEKAVQEFNAIGATGIVMDVKSGELLAMSSLPDFDPHKPARARDEQKFNRAALGTYEMGSTMKSFTFAMALDGGVTTMKGGYDATNPLKFASFTISDAHGKKRWLSVPEIYAYSSNIGTARMLLDAGVKPQRRFLEKIGMLSPVEIELPERAQPLYPKDWRELSAITISYGHGLSISPLHLARGIATLVGGGVLRPLTLVKDGNKNRAEGERVISEETSQQMRRLMRLVVTHGTGGKANINGYRVAGKTGTAEKVQAGGTYNKDNKMASFVAAFPGEDPRYVILVMVDEPRGNKASFGYATGGWVSAPAVGRIVERMAPIVGVQPVYDTPADDAEQYWVDTEKKPGTQQAVTPAAKRGAGKFIQAAVYR